MGLRYRLGLIVPSDHTQADHSFHQINWTGGYKLSWGNIGYDLELKRYQDSDNSHANHTNYDHTIAFSADYTQFKSGWIPFGEVAMITTKSDSDMAYKDRHDIRLRAGAKFNF